MRMSELNSNGVSGLIRSPDTGKGTKQPKLLYVASADSQYDEWDVDENDGSTGV